MLLDDFLPAYEFDEIHAVTVHAPPDRVFAAIHEMRAGELSPLVNLLLSIRNLPGRLLRKGGPRLADDQPFLRQLLDGGFIPLGETPDREVAFGLIGQFWKLTGGDGPPITSSEQYLAFDDPRYAKWRPICSSALTPRRAACASAPRRASTCSIPGRAASLVFTGG
jgi:hypothetical protein